MIRKERVKNSEHVCILVCVYHVNFQSSISINESPRLYIYQC